MEVVLCLLVCRRNESFWLACVLLRKKMEEAMNDGLGAVHAVVLE